ncbi:MAG: DNA methyltransferase [bacterium]
MGVQIPLDIQPGVSAGKNETNRLYPGDRAAHDWYRFILSFPPHLVRTYLEQFGADTRHTVLDPFCGTGTTLVECCKLGISTIGIEAVPMPYFATSVKVDWVPQPARLLAHASEIAESALVALERDGVPDIPYKNVSANGHHLRALPELQIRLLLKDSISPLPLHKALVLRDSIEDFRNDHYYRHERLALAKAIVASISNLRFGPEVGVGQIKADTPVVATWLAEIRAMAKDLEQLQRLPIPRAIVHSADSRDLLCLLPPNSIDFVITSPPYPNEKDYTRTTRLESVLLGLIQDRKSLQQLKRKLVRSNTRNVYKGDDDDRWVEHFPKIQHIAKAIEKRRLELGKTSGFERLYPKVTKLYFGGMARHLSDLRGVLRPEAQLAYVVGDQASYLQVMIHTGQILAEIAESLGYEIVSIDLFRSRVATVTRHQLREEVVVLRWPGKRES